MSMNADSTTGQKGLRACTGSGSQSSHQELKKWIKWVKSARACRKLEANQQGPFIYTLLQGSVPEVRGPSELQVADRGPGVLLLHKSGNTPDQQAIVKVKAAGYSADEMGKTIRTVFPTCKVPKLRFAEAGVMMADQAGDDDKGWINEFDGLLSSSRPAPEDDCADIDALLVGGEGHGADEAVEEMFEESDVVEVLAATWKEERRGINGAKKSRIFYQADKLQIMFRRELDDAGRL
ncbi:unnamed protein product, partial [Prorocentrum cordatum]